MLNNITIKDYYLLGCNTQ